MKILIINPFGIGDVLFTTPLLNALTESGHSVYYWSNERVVDIIKHNPAIKGMFSLTRGDIKKIFKRSVANGVAKSFDLFKKLRREKFDAALDFSLDYRYSLILWLLGVKKRIGFDYKSRGRFLTDAIKIGGFEKKHIVEHYNGLLKLIDNSFKPAGSLELYIGSDDSKAADIFLQKHGIAADDTILGIAPGGGGSWGKDAFRKRWPKEKFGYIAENLASEQNCKIIIFGSSGESDICAYIKKMSGTRSIDTCGKFTLGEYAAALRRCKVFITNDGGPLHMAIALGVPTVSIFGPVDENVYGPYPSSNKHEIIRSSVECRPCYKGFKYRICAALRCLDSIEPDDVLKAVQRVL